MTVADRDVAIPSYSHEAEQAVIGCILLEGRDPVPNVVEILAPTDFYIDTHRTTYEAVLRLFGRGEPIDLITLTEELRRAGQLGAVGGPAALALLVEQASIAANVAAYAEIVREHGAKRELQQLAGRIGLSAQNGARAADVMAEITAELERLRRHAARRSAVFGVGLGEFLAMPELEAEPYVEGILGSDGGGWIGGEEKLGKTYYALEEALCLALGLQVCGRFAVHERRRVFFLEEEDSPRRTKMRVSALLRGHDLVPELEALRDELDRWFRLAVWSGFTFDNAAMVNSLRATIVDFEPAVIYVDVLRKVTLRDLNKASEASALFDVLDDMRRTYGVVFRVLHHYRKAQSFRVGRGSQEISGSFVLGAWGESSLFFEPVSRKHGGPVRVAVQLKDGAAEPFLLRIESEGPRHSPTVVRLRADEDKSTEDADELVVQAVATLPKTEAQAGKPGVTVQAIVTGLKRSDKTVRRALKRLLDAGRVVVTGQASRGKDLYAVAEL